jgi:RimJ/RimL family protein N-acetyltransferase
MKLRDTSEFDVEAVAKLVDAVARERRYLATTVGFPVEGTRAFLSSLRASGGVHIVAVDSDRVVGWCDVVPQPFEGMRHVGRLGMGLDKDFRRRGFGRILLEAAVQKAFASGIRRIELEVFASNESAIRLYESFGFMREGRKIAAREIDGAVDDIILYALRQPAYQGGPANGASPHR